MSCHDIPTTIISIGVLLIVSSVRSENTNAKYYASILQYDASTKTTSRICGGAIIHERFVLTTASCVYGKNITSLIVNAGSIDEHPTYRILKRVARIYQCPEYVQGNVERDMAVVKITGTFELVDLQNFAKVHLPLLESDYEKKSAILSGYGKQNFESFQVNVVSNRDCQFEKLHNLTNDVLCTKPMMESTECFGTSGDPLIHNNRIIGLLSTVAGCDSRGAKLFTRVSSFFDLIKHATYGYSFV